MKPVYFAVLGLFLALPALAQEADIPLFDDGDRPNLGRHAKPLDQITLTPPELPAVKVSLSERKHPARIAAPEPDSVPADTSADTAPARRVMVPPAVDMTAEETTDLSRQLNAGVQRYQAEQEQAAREQAAARARAQKEQQARAAREQAKKNTQNPVEQDPADPLAELMKTKDVRSFDIAGLTLGMTPEDVWEVARENGYQITRVEHGIPLHQTSYYDRQCRDARHLRTDALKNCILSLAKQDDVYYVSSITLAKPQTAEYIQVLFTGNHSDNGAYKIYYENKGDNSLNFTQKNFAKKVRRRDAFWKTVFETYGYPDDREQLIWGDAQKAYLLARMQGSQYNAYLVLEDKDMYDADLIEADARGKELHYRHSFTFAGNNGEDAD